MSSRNVAILSDIHGNSEALKAVLKDLPADVKELWILGDLVGYYYNIKEVLELLSPYNNKMIKGNHEVLLEMSRTSAVAKDEYKKKYGSSLELALSELDGTQLDFFKNLPETLVVEDKYRLSHGAPWDVDQYVYPDSLVDIYDQFLQYPEQIFFLGHTHYTMDISYKGKRIINPGSVGQQRNRVAGAHWGLLNLGSDQFTQMSSMYDVDAVVAQVRKYDPENSYLEKVLRRTV